jgi:hypothetical protein
MAYSDAFNQLMQDDRKRRSRTDWFPATDPGAATAQADAIDQAAIAGAQGSPLTAKVMAGLTGFMQTSGMGGSGGGATPTGAETAGNAATGASTAATGAGFEPLLQYGGSSVAPGVQPAAPDATPMTSVGNERTAAAPPVSSVGAPSSTGAQSYSARMAQLQKSRDAAQMYADIFRHDPNQGAKNIGRIAGIVARFYGA